MVERSSEPVNAVVNKRATRQSQLALILGLGLVLLMIVLPVVFSRQFDEWGTIPVNEPFSAIAGVEVHPGEQASIHITTLWNNGGQNRSTQWETAVITATMPITRTVELEWGAGAAVGTGDVLEELDGWCCFARDGFYQPDGSFVTAVTAPGGLFHLVTVEPAGTVSTQRVEAASTSDWTGLIAQLNNQFIVGTSSTDTNEYRFASAWYTQTTPLNHVFSVPAKDVFDGYHAGITESSDGNSFFFAYIDSNWTANVMRFSDGIDWVVPIAEVSSTPDEFYYLATDYDAGNLAIRVPTDGESYLWYALDVDNTTPPTQVSSMTDTGLSPGDYQALWVDGSRVTEVVPDSDGVGTMIRCTEFYIPDLSLAPSTWSHVDNTTNSTWNVGLPRNMPSGAHPDNPAPGQLVQISETDHFVISGDQPGATLKYGTVETPLFFDSFESDSWLYWTAIVN